MTVHSGDKNVPIRLLPVGTLVEVSGTNNRTVRRRVGTPIKLDDGTVVCRYRDCMNEWDWVQPSTCFNVAYIDPSKRTHKLLDSLNA